ncbi:MAG: hypothetical protein M0C28_27765 [Candidatus Moduliflexus flocculans]|nr:hypothetical protein [Candidatus Moduliflexus flocculans]
MPRRLRRRLHVRRPVQARGLYLVVHDLLTTGRPTSSSRTTSFTATTRSGGLDRRTSCPRSPTRTTSALNPGFS